jgi:hypothetical protein
VPQELWEAPSAELLLIIIRPHRCAGMKRLAINWGDDRPVGTEWHLAQLSAQDDVKRHLPKVILGTR